MEEVWGTVSKAVQKTLKIRLLPVSKGDKALTHCLSKDYTTLLREALDIVVRSDVRSRRRAHELCYKRLREKYPHLHNKYVEEAYKRSLNVQKLQKASQKVDEAQIRKTTEPRSEQSG
ncbi:MAG: hypothetical protein QXU09_03030 [Thermoproteota archaeon]